MIVKVPIVLILGMLFTAATLGCGPSGLRGVKVAGSVDLDGQPLSSGVVIMENSTSGAGVSAPVTAGRFQFANGVIPGLYKVSVQPAQSGSPLAAPDPAQEAATIPQRYMQSATSNLKAEINSNIDSLRFELRSKE
jgi:hypothetical protein